MFRAGAVHGGDGDERFLVVSKLGCPKDRAARIYIHAIGCDAIA